MSEPITIALHNCRMDFWPDEGRHRTSFACGCAVDAVWTYEPADFEHAAEIGYSKDVAGVRQMHLQHDLLHTFLADALEHRASQTIWHVAHKERAGWYRDWQAEERRALSFANYLNTGKMQPALQAFGDRLPALAAEARALLARLDTPGAG